MIDPIYWIWFAAVFGYGTRRAAETLERFPNPEALYHMSSVQRNEASFFSSAEKERMNQTDLAAATGHLERAEQLGCTVLTLDDPNYPERLRNIYSPPVALYILGHPHWLNAPLSISMVGSRKCSDYGRRMADHFSRALAQAGAVVVSGMAKGIDQLCHTGAMKAGGGTVGVLGCGVDVPYPAGSSTLRELMVTYGALVSEYPPGTPAQPKQFPVRNRILTGLSQGVVVVEASIQSGSLVSARLAADQGRDVFAIPGRVDEPNTGGINQLLRQGAIPVFGLEDILVEYPDWREKNVPLDPSALTAPFGESQKAQQENKPPRKTLSPKEPAGLKQEHPVPDFLGEAEGKVYQALAANPQTSDDLAECTGLPIQQVLAALTQLELYGLAAPMGGRTFTIV